MDSASRRIDETVGGRQSICRARLGLPFERVFFPKSLGSQLYREHAGESLVHLLVHAAFSQGKSKTG